tara:strand:- start:42 stop:296 length:255 start_codon:yes stop_codon:yes gene_type:complete
MNELENFKKKLLYRSNYRGTKEMDLLLNTFVKKYINQLDRIELKELEKFLDFEDEIIFNFYYYDIVKENIDKNKISNLFKKHLI